MTDTAAAPSSVLGVRYDKDADNIVTLTLDDPNASANTMNEAYAEGMKAALGQLDKEIGEGSVTGVVITSAKSTFFAGGNLKQLLAVGPDDAQQIFDTSMELK